MRLNGLAWQHGRAAALPGSEPAALAQSATLQMELTAQPGDIKGALDSINSFVRDLGKNDKVAEVKVTKMPVNLASSGNLSGSTAANPRQEQAQASQFDVQVTLKPGV
jgi:hypothetical protein